MENIGNFLSACEKFGVPKSDLFQTVDLYEAENLAQVITGLRAVGRKVNFNILWLTFLHLTVCIHTKHTHTHTQCMLHANANISTM
jgi:hypothetical protein